MELWCVSFDGAHDRLTDREVKPIMRGFPGGSGTSGTRNTTRLDDRCTQTFTCYKVIHAIGAHGQKCLCENKISIFQIPSDLKIKRKIFYRKEFELQNHSIKYIFDNK